MRQGYAGDGKEARGQTPHDSWGDDGSVSPHRDEREQPHAYERSTYLREDVVGCDGGHWLVAEDGGKR